MEALEAYSQMVKQEIAKRYGDTSDENIQRWKDNLRLSQFGTVDEMRTSVKAEILEKYGEINDETIRVWQDMKEREHRNSKGLI
jgi:hypothetical protein